MQHEDNNNCCGHDHNKTNDCCSTNKDKPRWKKYFFIVLVIAVVSIITIKLVTGNHEHDGCCGTGESACCSEHNHNN